MTYTYSVLEVPRAVYAAVRALLAAADYEHAFHPEDDGEVIDMRGIALRAKPGPPTVASITASSLVSSRTKEGRVEFQLNGELVQLDLEKAREVVSMLQGAIEAAVSDALILKFLVEKVGLGEDAAGAALIDFREMRQGSRETVYPQ